MKCSEVREACLQADGGAVPPDMREHLKKCLGCEAYQRDLEMLRAGWKALRLEPPPEASTGFAARLRSRLEREGEARWTAATFLEGVGRRFVYAALMLAVVLLLAVVAPSTGPVRADRSAETYLAQPEALAYQNDSPFPVEDSSDLSDFSVRPSHPEEPDRK